MEGTISNDLVILVDELDSQLGLMEKMQAHTEGKLHRAVSVFIFNSKKELVLQKRAAGKYHSPGLWTNTCCTHPQDGEAPRTAATRRLKEEMGMACNLEKAFSFVYKAALDQQLTEYEYDHVFVGITDDVPIPEASEVNDWRYIALEALVTEMRYNPEKYTEWFKICVAEHRDKISSFHKQS